MGSSRLKIPVVLPRHAFSARDSARAASIWRAAQDVAVEASTRCGWPPLRYREAGTAFVVREMTVVHEREAYYGEPVEGETWVRRLRRGTLTTREIRLRGEAGALASVTQEWVHVNAQMKPSRASDELVSDFAVDPSGEPVAMPTYTKRPQALPSFSFSPWHTWMDPLAHVNHPMYVDFCDEAIARWLALRGVAPDLLVPVAESLIFRHGATAGDEVRVETQVAGSTPCGSMAFIQKVSLDGGERCVDAVVVRRLHEDAGRTLWEVLEA